MNDLGTRSVEELRELMRMRNEAEREEFREHWKEWFGIALLNLLGNVWIGFTIGVLAGSWVVVEAVGVGFAYLQR